MVRKLLAMNLLIPLALLVRFGLLTPLSFVFPVVRRKVIPAFLHLSIRMPYTAPELPERFRQEGVWVEAACMAFAWLMMGLGLNGRADILLVWSGLLIAIATMNTWRAAGATHLYLESASGRDTLGQVLDSTNVDGGKLLTTLLCPAGLQFHALHHLVPYLPYHNLARAHARLLARLPTDSLYRQSTVATMAQGWRRVLGAESALSMAESAAGGRVESPHTWQTLPLGLDVAPAPAPIAESGAAAHAPAGREDRLPVP